METKECFFIRFVFFKFASIFLIFFCSLFLISLFFPNNARAQVVINEFSSATSSDWVEVINIATESADLTQYRIRDSTSTNSKTLNGSLSPGSVLSFSFGNYLNNSGDIVKLFKLVGGTEQGINEVSYGEGSDLCAPDGDQTIGRKPDGTGDFFRLLSSTKDQNNNTEILSCPTPTPTPTPTDPPPHNCSYFSFYSISNSY